jgi:Fe2+ transport system protein B
MKVEFNKEIELPRKTQTEIKLERKNLDFQTNASEISFTNQSQNLDERISGVDDNIEEKARLVKENAKSIKKKIQTQNIQKKMGYHEKTKPLNNRNREKRRNSSQLVLGILLFFFILFLLFKTKFKFIFSSYSFPSPSPFKSSPTP